MEDRSALGVGLQLQGVPTVRLGQELQGPYVDTVAEVLRTARLNAYYPDWRRLVAHLRAMTPAVHRGLYPTLLLDLRSGLPAYQEWVRVQSDAQLAPRVLADLGDRDALAAKAEKADIYAKQLRKWDYHKDLEGIRLAPLGDMQVRLRRVEPSERTAYFNVILDKLDVSGLFVRYTIDLAQTAEWWTRPMLTLDEETARHTEGFKSLVYRFTSLDAEFAYFKLVAVGGLKVERVFKGTVGPLYFAGRPYEDPLGRLVRNADSGVVATFGLDMVAGDLEASRDNDPILDLFEASLSEQAREDYERARARLGYKVFKDRKFVVTPNFRAPVLEFCRRAGTRNLVRVVRLPGQAGGTA